MKKVILILVTALLLFFSREIKAQGSRIGFSVENDSVTVIIFSLGKDEKVFYTINPKDSPEEPFEFARLELEGEQTFLIPPLAHSTPHTLYIYIERSDGTLAEEKSLDIQL
jgi:hypothetical protein